VVDYLHYSPDFNRFLADEVARHVDLRALRRSERFIVPEVATGQPRTPPGAGRT
jgi:hypothetical protein